MKSVKPGRGSSQLSVAGGVFAALFGIVWCILGGVVGAWFMIPFGVLFVGFAIYIIVYNYHNATSENRYSVIDIVDSDEEPDPLNDRYGRKKTVREPGAGTDLPGTGAKYCPYCGNPVEKDFEFCAKCGKKLPD